MTPTGEPAVGEGPRGAITAAAKKVFARKGFEGATLADVAGEAGLPFDAVYQISTRRTRCSWR
jgi:AcrR family transcriptional regulator